MRIGRGDAVTEARDRSTTTNAPWIALALVAIVSRLLVIRKLGLFNDEAYYWEWSRHLAASYFDHPPAVAYAIAASTHVFGRTAFAIHLPAVLFAALTSVALFAHALDLFPGRRFVAWWAVAACNVAPLFGIGAVFTTPDAPCAFFWVATIALVWRAVHGSPRAWYLAGVTSGLGLLSKYTFVLVPIAVAIYLLAPRHRRWWRRREPYAAAAIALVLDLPVLIWNARHGWASIAFQAVERHAGPWQVPPTLLRFLVAQQALSTPLWIACVVALVRSVILARRGDDVHRFLACCSATVLAFFAVAALHTWVNPNWVGLAFVPLMIGAADLLEARSWVLKAVPLGVAAAVTGTFLVQALWLVFPVPASADLAVDLHGWEEVGERCRELVSTMPDPERTFAFSGKFQLSALAAFHAGDGVRVTRITGRRDAYDEWRDDASLAGHDAILLREDDHVPRAGDYAFRSCDAAGRLPIERNGRTLRTFSFWRCWDYRP